jgi:formylglycine-generating enzyme required for sulfatase activity
MNSKVNLFFISALLCVLNGLAPSLSAAGSRAPLICRDLFATPIEQIDLTIRNLARLRLTLDLAQAQSPAAPQVTALRRDYGKKEAHLLVYLEDNKIMNRVTLLKLMSEEIVKLQIIEPLGELEQQEVQKKKELEKNLIQSSQPDGVSIPFNPVPKGSFPMNKQVGHVEVEITKPFQMAVIPTTQYVWMKIAKQAIFRDPALSGMIKVAPSGAFGKYANPVEKVSYMDVRVWINALNQLAKLDDPIVKEMMPGHTKGDVYRLPTNAEWEYVARSFGINQNRFILSANKVDRDLTAWHSANSGGSTHPVGLKQPLTIDGKNFYDLQGNVWEWVSDWFSESPEGGKDPTGPEIGQTRVIRGGSYKIDPESLTLDLSSKYLPSAKSSSIGFRLVRVSP